MLFPPHSAPVPAMHSTTNYKPVARSSTVNNAGRNAPGHPLPYVPDHTSLPDLSRKARMTLHGRSVVCSLNPLPPSKLGVCVGQTMESGHASASSPPRVARVAFTTALPCKQLVPHCPHRAICRGRPVFKGHKNHFIMRLWPTPAPSTKSKICFAAIQRQPANAPRCRPL